MGLLVDNVERRPKCLTPLEITGSDEEGQLEVAPEPPMWPVIQVACGKRGAPQAAFRPSNGGTCGLDPFDTER